VKRGQLIAHGGMQIANYNALAIAPFMGYWRDQGKQKASLTTAMSTFRILHHAKQTLYYLDAVQISIPLQIFALDRLCLSGEGT
jgi:hypothetical protein